jgi:ribulose kinase
MQIAHHIAYILMLAAFGAAGSIAYTTRRILLAAITPTACAVVLALIIKMDDFRTFNEYGLWGEFIQMLLRQVVFYYGGLSAVGAFIGYSLAPTIKKK